MRWLMNSGKVSLIHSGCVCFPKVGAFASSDIGAYGTYTLPTLGLRYLFMSINISLEWEFYFQIKPYLKKTPLIS